MPYTPGPADGGIGPTAVEGVRDRQERALMAIDGVVGVATGRTSAGDDAIVVYVRDASVGARVPRQAEGYPIEVVVTGEIDAYGIRPESPGPPHRP